MFAASKTDSVSGAAPDGQFNYVTMLLHGDGTNGAQNNTFLDSSTNNFTITRNGNTTQGSFSPYGSNWSAYFNGTTAYLSIAKNTAFNFGSGSFTLECWVHAGAFIVATPLWGQQQSSTTARNSLALRIDASGNPQLQASAGTSNDVLITSSTAMALNTWNHIAGVRNGNDWTLYLNGVSVGTATSSITVNYDSTYGDVLIGASRNVLTFDKYYTGYISNLRIVKGTAVYTGAFTPSTTPLTAITNTSLLTCKSNRFVDNSTSPLTITVNGTPSVQRFNPFGTSTAYSTSVIGGSGYFDGDGDYLTAANNTALDVGTGAFTIEGWIYRNGTGDTDWRIVAGNTSNAGFFGGRGTLSVGFGRAAVAWDLESPSNVYSLNTWNHIVYVRNGSGNLAIFVNGTSVATTTNSNNYGLNSGLIQVGAEGANQYFGGYISNVRVVKGTAVYDPTASTLTVPTAPLTAVSGTGLLTNFINGAIFDNAMMNDLETVGNAQISTSVTKYGTGSISLSASGNTLRTQYNNPSLSMGTGDFTIEGWVYFSSTPSTNGVFQMSGTSGGFAPNQTANLALATNNSTSWQIYAKNTFTTSSTTTIAVGSWIHFALVRSGTTTVLYINGTALITLTSDSTNYNTPYIGLGAIYDATSYPLGGYIDDLRITKGYARYTTTFTPPTAAFSDTGPY